MSKKDFTTSEYKDRKGFCYVDVSDAVSGLYRFANFTRAECKRVAKQYEKEAVDYVQANAPWQDRTGNARRTIKAEYFEHGSSNSGLDVGVRVSYGVKYGVFLEYNGIYAGYDYLKRRRAILIMDNESPYKVTPLIKSNLTKQFMEDIRKGFSKIARQMR